MPPTPEAFDYLKQFILQITFNIAALAGGLLFASVIYRLSKVFKFIVPAAFYVLICVVFPIIDYSVFDFAITKNVSKLLSWMGESVWYMSSVFVGLDVYKRQPYICLVASGGHSHIVEVIDYTKFRIIGRTRDDAAGECFDKCARAMGFPYPGGIHIDRAAQLGDKSAYVLPRPRVTGCEYDFSFSGLKTAVINLLHNAEQKGKEINKNDLSAALQHTISDIPVSYTHLDVYKRQHRFSPWNS